MTGSGPFAWDEGSLIQGIQVSILGDVVYADAPGVALSTVKVCVVQVWVSVAFLTLRFGGNLFFAAPRGDRVLGRALALPNRAYCNFWQLAKLV